MRLNLPELNKVKFANKILKFLNIDLGRAILDNNFVCFWIKVPLVDYLGSWSVQEFFVQEDYKLFRCLSPDHVQLLY